MGGSSESGVENNNDLSEAEKQKGTHGENRKMETVIVVHGTFAAPEIKEEDSESNSGPESQSNTEQNNKHKSAQEPPWYYPEGSFCVALDEELEKLGSSARCWKHLDKDMPTPEAAKDIFTWDGANSWWSRRVYAKKLKEYLNLLSDAGWVCHVVAHSHGGNLLLNAVEISDSDPLYYLSPESKFVTLGTPFFDLEPQRSFGGHKKGRKNLSSWQERLTAVWIMISIIFIGIVGLLMIQNSPDSASEQFWSIKILFLVVFSSAFFLLLTQLFRVLLSFFNPDAMRSRRMGAYGDAFFDSNTQFLVISSDEDEVWLGLSAILKSKNPFLQGSHSKNVEVSAEMNDGLFSLKRAYQRTKAKISNLEQHIFPGVQEPGYLMVLTVFLMLAGLSLGYLLEILPANNHLAYTFIFLACLIYLLVQIKLDQATLVAVLLWPLRAVFKLFSYFVNLIALPILKLVVNVAKLIMGKLFNYFGRGMAWRMALDYAFGLDGSPYSAKGIGLCQRPSHILHTDSYEHEKLPQGVIDKVRESQRKQSGDKLTHFFQEIGRPDFNDVEAALKKIGEDVPLVHSVYYDSQYQENISRIANWIQQEMGHKSTMDPDDLF